ncbi:hypothetical protein UA08_00990 [Talaromyces atroroseus]|uniref:Pisatin demethylase n=1 Tax=Talaromyces atroroseus TaxID=1441469 RepID=A0A225BAP8_TALAT|nr:hypothetical protein UA08_00990 [Talaromyces atroroseus]OKL64466.1 hypothetical protein UA08_00990 [Talaromyces atroroseus]
MSGGLVLYALSAAFAAWILFFVYRQLASPLRHIPGPFWTRFTRAWYLYRLSQGHFEKENIDLHNEFGSIVRIAPGWYSCSGTEAIKKIYGLGSKFTKSDWLFAGLYSLTSLMSYEPFVNRCIDLFVDRLSEFSQTNEEIDLGHWMQCYAFDVIGCITFGERLGFLDSGEDIEGVIRAVDSIPGFASLSGIYSEWHSLLYKINSYLTTSGASGRNFLASFAREKITNHKQQQQKDLAEKTQEPDGIGSTIVNQGEDGTTSREPFMTKMIRAQLQNPEKVSDYHLIMLARSNMGAGFDTTAISLSSIIYHLIKTPRVVQKLRAEFDAARKAGRLSDRVTFHESQDLPYFQAVMKEALRMHSATGLPLWRVVPEGGVELNGVHFPEGTILGINSWVSHYNKDVFTNPTEFCPERWIEQDEAKLKTMNDMYMPFGLGSRTCIGRHISILEMSKLIPVLVDRFDFVMASSASPSGESKWETENFWFVKPRNFRVRVYQKGLRD